MTNREEQPDAVTHGAASYDEWRRHLRDDPDYRTVYDEEAAKGDLWLQLVEARRAAGLTQEEVARRLGMSPTRVARIETRGYDADTLGTLRRYVAALGGAFALDVTVRRIDDRRTATLA